MLSMNTSLSFQGTPFSQIKDGVANQQKTNLNTFITEKNKAIQAFLETNHFTIQLNGAEITIDGYAVLEALNENFNGLNGMFTKNRALQQLGLDNQEYAFLKVVQQMKDMGLISETFLGRITNVRRDLNRPKAE